MAAAGGSLQVVYHLYKTTMLIEGALGPTCHNSLRQGESGIRVQNTAYSGSTYRHLKYGVSYYCKATAQDTGYYYGASFRSMAGYELW